MPLVVHIASEKNAERIRKGGISPGKRLKAVYFMPVVRDHFISHQWLRELKRSGAKTMVGVYVRMDSSEMVWAGRYNQEHRHITLGEAIRELNFLADPLGYELFISRKIAAAEITRIRALPQKIGWRYMPNAHGRPPCPCPRCLVKGEYGSAKIRERLDPMPQWPRYADTVNVLKTSDDISTLEDKLWPLRNKRRVADPEFLQRLFAFDDEYLLEELARTLPYFKHPASADMLRRLRESHYENVREAAEQSLSALAMGKAALPD